MMPRIRVAQPINLQPLARSSHTVAMPKRSSKPSDPNAMAAAIVAEATEDQPKKNPAAVELGRLGGKKGGPARAKALSPKRRKEIAKKAAAVRWARS